ncbi:hypothetical protein HOC01_02480 [archaeon]|nr:hypothetical protein [archaeon]MBT6697815.1 hypothetical protein [archaeon]
MGIYEVTHGADALTNFKAVLDYARAELGVVPAWVVMDDRINKRLPMGDFLADAIYNDSLGEGNDALIRVTSGGDNEDALVSMRHIGRSPTLVGAPLHPSYEWTFEERAQAYSGIPEEMEGCPELVYFMATDRDVEQSTRSTEAGTHLSRRARGEFGLNNIVVDYTWSGVIEKVAKDGLGQEFRDTLEHGRMPVRAALEKTEDLEEDGGVIYRALAFATHKYLLAMTTQDRFDPNVWAKEFATTQILPGRFRLENIDFRHS